MEEVTRRTITKEVEECVVECSSCGKKVIGSTEGQVRWLLRVHKSGSKCKQ